MIYKELFSKFSRIGKLREDVKFSAKVELAASGSRLWLPASAKPVTVGVCTFAVGWRPAKPVGLWVLIAAAVALWRNDPLMTGK